jgi:hypothetical protein
MGSGLFYGMPVQPMKAVSAVLLTGGLGAAEVAATGLLIGAFMLVLGLTGAIARDAVPGFDLLPPLKFRLPSNSVNSERSR